MSSLGGVPITGICLVRYGKPRPCRTKIHRGDRGCTGNPGFAVPDFYPTGLSRAGRFGTAETAFLCRTGCIGVGLRFFSHGARTFPVGLCGAAAFCGINCVKLWSATAPLRNLTKSGYYIGIAEKAKTDAMDAMERAVYFSELVQNNS